MRNTACYDDSRFFWNLKNHREVFIMTTNNELKKGRLAYACGEMPITRWTKAIFVAAVEKALGLVPDWVKALPKIRMYDYLVPTGVYVTGNCWKYRHTTFYKVDIRKVLRNCS
jgi:hypothetical protein